MENKKNFGLGTQIRKSPYFNSTVKWGATVTEKPFYDPKKKLASG
tara:strand:+ start:216 stop:350 length:135 start_codon:yes stop_codon:yes gene_type:complete